MVLAAKKRGPKTAPPLPAPLPAQGIGGKKRTPQSAFDPAAGGNIYEPEKVVAERLAKGITQYNVKWVGYEAKHNTWEPIENLAGCEDLIAAYKELQRQKTAEIEAAAVVAKAAKDEEKRQEEIKWLQAQTVAAAAEGGPG